MEAASHSRTSTRWEFRRYDHRRRGICRSRGWLHYVGLGHVLMVIGFHRGLRGKTRLRPWAWIEITLYAGDRMFDAYPGLPIRHSWL